MYRALLALGLLFLLGGCGEADSPAGSTSHSAAAVRAPVVLIGVDGGEWEVIDQMIAAGELPNFARLKRDGAWARLVNPGPLNSPVVWTTFVTGHFSRRHGILEQVFPYTEGGAKRLVTSELRREPALWNIASAHGLGSTVLGYYVTHPAEPINGYMLSPLAPHGAPGSSWPAGLIDPADPVFAELETPQFRQAKTQQWFGWPYQPAQAKDPGSPYHAAAQIVLQRNLYNRIHDDEYLRRAAVRLAGEPFDLFIAYFRVPDYMSHSLWAFHDPQGLAEPPPAQLQELFGDSVRESYRFVDAALGELLGQWREQDQLRANVMIVSDHGFGHALKKRPDDQRKVTALSGDHRPDGILLAAGPDFAIGEVRGISILEIAPTLLALLGLPVSDELPGRVATGLLAPDFLERHPLWTVPGYADITVERQDIELQSKDLEEDMRSLRGLGYVGEGVATLEDTRAGDWDFWQSSDAIITDNLQMEANYYLLEGDLEAALAVHQELAARRPDLTRRLHYLVRSKYEGLTARLPPDSLDPEPFTQYLQATLPASPIAANSSEAAPKPAQASVE